MRLVLVTVGSAAYLLLHACGGGANGGGANGGAGGSGGLGGAGGIAPGSAGSGGTQATGGAQGTGGVGGSACLPISLPNAGVQIYEIKPGDYITLVGLDTYSYNPMILASSGPAGSGSWQDLYPSFLLSLTPGAAVRIAWPTFLASTPTEASGALLLKQAFHISLDFVCWGSADTSWFHNGGLGLTAMTANELFSSGSCAPAIPAGGVLRRLPNTDGKSASSYQVFNAGDTPACATALTTVAPTPP